MSRIANDPIVVPKGVEVKLAEESVSVKGGLGSLSLPLSPLVAVKQDGEQITFGYSEDVKGSKAMAGTMRSLIDNMVVGVSEGFQRKLQLVGVGYRAQAQGDKLNLSLGFSHPVVYEMPKGVSVETPSQTEIVLKASDKQVLGQVAAEIRAFRPPEPYKGKGVRYAEEQVRRKEAKKK